MERFERVIVNPAVCHGKPVVRGTRIMVTNILSLLAGGYTVADIRGYFPELEDEDITAAIDYAASVVDDQVVLSSRP